MTQTAFSTDLSSVRVGATLRRRATSALLGLTALALAWTGIHEIPGSAPLLADTLRSVIGVNGVARLEDAVYGARDEVNQVLRSGEEPKQYWEAAPLPLSRPGTTVSPSSLGESQPKLKPFVPAPVGPLFETVAAPGDGAWTRVDATSRESLLFKTLLHPDPSRTWAELFVVAIDLRGVDLHLVAGSREPEAKVAGSESLARKGKIPRGAYGELLAAFNGGFKTQHGNFGAKIDGVTLVEPKPQSCTIAMTQDGELYIRTWKNLSARESFAWFRQTPGCMVEEAQLHPGLKRDDNTNWGATLDGGTVIRRSALGLSPDGQTLFFGFSNDTTARALALGMRHAGATQVAQLDVNYSYPKFILYDSAKEGRLTPRSLAPGFVFHEAQYLKAEARDFFYLTKKSSRDE